MEKNVFSIWDRCTICKEVVKEFAAESWNPDGTKTFYCRDCYAEAEAEDIVDRATIEGNLSDTQEKIEKYCDYIENKEKNMEAKKMKNKKIETWNTSKISIGIADKEDRKFHAKHCESCKENVKKKVPLFFVVERTFETLKDLEENTDRFVNDIHLFTAEQLDKKLDKGFFVRKGGKENERNKI